mmetsp:Transcript_57811/g.126833  ORF Transcript_57811/g.126833 Transcript_57811/m.126833 type:complete len:206 (+) Transcript_57811:764-1381(+)
MCALRILRIHDVGQSVSSQSTMMNAFWCSALPVATLSSISVSSVTRSSQTFPLDSTVTQPDLGPVNGPSASLYLISLPFLSSSSMIENFGRRADVAMPFSFRTEMPPGSMDFTTFHKTFFLADCKGAFSFLASSSWAARARASTMLIQETSEDGGFASPFAFSRCPPSTVPAPVAPLSVATFSSVSSGGKSSRSSKSNMIVSAPF